MTPLTLPPIGAALVLVSAGLAAGDKGRRSR